MRPSKEILEDLQMLEALNEMHRKSIKDNLNQMEMLLQLEALNEMHRKSIKELIKYRNSFILETKEIK